jgi:hypothetical protein
MKRKWWKIFDCFSISNAIEPSEIAKEPKMDKLRVSTPHRRNNPEIHVSSPHGSLRKYQERSSLQDMFCIDFHGITHGIIS